MSQAYTLILNRISLNTNGLYVYDIFYLIQICFTITRQNYEE